MPFAIYRAGIALEGFDIFLISTSEFMTPASSMEDLRDLTVAMRGVKHFGLHALFESLLSTHKNIDVMRNYISAVLDTDSLKTIDLTFTIREDIL